MEYIALNPGASYRGLHDSLVNYGGNKPEIILCTHEEVAVSIAHGYAKATGRPMAAAVHDTVGLLHAAMTIPAYNRSRDFVADSIAEDCRVTSTGTHSLAYSFLYRPCPFLIIEEGDMLFPRKAYHHAESICCAASSSQLGGTVYVRMAFSPFAAIKAKSCSTTCGSWFSLPSSSRRNVP